MNPKDQIKQSLSILDVVSTYVKLEKSGSQFKGRCPFHNEKTPSFYVSPERSTYHCFGCSLHGDIFSFVEKIESVPFYEALTILADRAGVKLTPFKKEEKDKETNLISLLQKASLHYVKNLENSPEAKLYLGERGISAETIKKFNIGFAVGGESGWRDLFIGLAKEGFSPEEMIAAGVVIKKEGEEKYFDRFRGRIMFPIKNSFGNVVGYSARILPKYDDGKAGKYINSPETDVYHKGKILFGYFEAKKSIAEKREVILVEGQMDLIMSQQVGVENVVAVSGTALTDEHVKILKRFADKVLLSFDQDEAGEKAMKKSALLALYGGMDVFIIPKKEGIKDTADLVKEYGGEEWKNLINKKSHLIEYLTNYTFEKNSDDRERSKIIRLEVLPYLRAMESDMDRAYFLRYLANKLKIAEIDILNDLIKVKVSDEFISNNKEIIKEEKNLSKKDMLTRQIFSLIKWKNLDYEKILEEYNFEDGLKDIFDFKNIFLSDKDIIPDEIIEEEIIKLEKELSKNRDYIEREKKFINSYIDDLIKSYKLYILQNELNKIQDNKNEETDKDLKKVLLIHKNIQNIKSKK